MKTLLVIFFNAQIGFHIKKIELQIVFLVFEIGSFMYAYFTFHDQSSIYLDIIEGEMNYE